MNEDLIHEGTVFLPDFPRVEVPRETRNRELSLPSEPIIPTIDEESNEKQTEEGLERQ